MSKSTKRVALYARVSTSGQTVQNQLRVLRGAAKRHGWQVVETFADEGISGTKSREQRPAFDALCRGMMRRDFDMVAVWSVDRLGRSLQDLASFLAELHAKGVDLYLHQQGIDTTTPGGRAMFQVFGVFAEFERAMIVERVQAGLQRAREQGKRLGRPPADASVVEQARRKRASGASIRSIARELGVSVGWVHRIAGAEMTDPGRAFGGSPVRR